MRINKKARKILIKAHFKHFGGRCSCKYKKLWIYSQLNFKTDPNIFLIQYSLANSDIKDNFKTDFFLYKTIKETFTSSHLCDLDCVMLEIFEKGKLEHYTKNEVFY